MRYIIFIFIEKKTFQKTTTISILLLPQTCKVQWLAFVHLASRLASSPLAPPTSSQNRRRRRGSHGVDEGGGPGVAAEESQGVGGVWLGQIG